MMTAVPAKHSLDLSEDHLDAHYGDNSLIVMKTDFYNDDFYDYKDTFIQKISSAGRPAASEDQKLVKIMAGDEDYDYDLGVASDGQDDDHDDDNFFTTGPLAKKTTQSEDDYSGYDNQRGNFDENLLQFRDTEDENFCDEGEFINDFDNEEEDEAIHCDNFFKRVDSLDMCKPKKAKIVNNYLMGEMLGDGSYGKVKECIDLETLARRAVKIINLKVVARKIPRGVENVRKEISIMRRLDHKNVIRLYGTYEKAGQTLQQEQIQSPDASQGALDELLAITSTMVNIEKPPKLYIFMDYCMTSLEKLLKTAPGQRLCNWQANHYFRQICEGLDYLHSLNIIHNDIKPGNLLISCDDTLKICDFSISAELRVFYEEEYAKGAASTDADSDSYSPVRDGDVNPRLVAGRNRFPILQCTPMFQCPEMLNEDIDELLILKHAPKIDVWSTGITLFQLTTGQLPFEGQTIHQIFENIRSEAHKIRIPDTVDNNLRTLLTNMLCRDPVQRWSIKQIRDCEWFKKKHPLVRDDLAPLPEEAVQNEYATFRMISYLEKLCQTKSPNESENNDLKQYYDDMNQQHQCEMAGLNINEDQTPPVQQPVQPPSQATKIKKSNCSLM